MLSFEDKKKFIELSDEKKKLESELDEILYKVLDGGNEELVKQVDDYVKKIDEHEKQIFDLLMIDAVK